MAWLWPSTLNPQPSTRFVLHGWNEGQMRQAFLTAPDSNVFKGVIEQCDQSLMEAVQGLVNAPAGMTDGQMRERVGELRGITELREKLEAREEQARLDRQETKAEDSTL